MNVSFLPPALRCPGNTNDLHVIDEIQATSSGSSTSGLRFTFTTRLPAGTFWQVLNPSSVTGSDVEGPVGVGGGGGGGGGGGATGGATTGRRKPASRPGMRKPPSRLAMRKPPSLAATRRSGASLAAPASTCPASTPVPQRR